MVLQQHHIMVVMVEMGGWTMGKLGLNELLVAEHVLMMPNVSKTNAANEACSQELCFLSVWQHASCHHHPGSNQVKGQIDPGGDNTTCIVQSFIINPVDRVKGNKSEVPH